MHIHTTPTHTTPTHTYLYTSHEKLMQNVCSQLHHPHIIGGGVLTLPVGYRVHKPVLELTDGAEKIGLHKVHHRVV